MSVDVSMPDTVALVLAVTGFMVYAGVPLAKLVYEHVFGSPARVMEEACQEEEKK